MNTLIRFLIRHQFFLFFLVLEAISLWLLASNNYYQRSKFGNLSRSFYGYTSSLIQDGRSYLSLRQVNDQLAKDNLALRNQLAKQSVVLTPELYENLIPSDDLEFEFIHARVVNNSVNKQYNFLTLNVGRNQGVEKEMGVVTNNGVVGIISAVSDNYSTVISLLNVDLRLSAKLKRTGYFGSLYWDGRDYKKAILSEIPQHVEILQGDTISTSGFSAIFPPDIPLGTVDSYDKKAGNFYTIRLELFNDFKQLDYVWVIKNLHGDERDKLENPAQND